VCLGRIFVFIELDYSDYFPEGGTPSLVFAMACRPRLTFYFASIPPQDDERAALVTGSVDPSRLS